MTRLIKTANVIACASALTDHEKVASLRDLRKLADDIDTIYAIDNLIDRINMMLVPGEAIMNTFMRATR